MYKLIVLACVIAVAQAGAIGLGLGLPHTGYGFVGGLTKLPNLGYGNIASVNSNQNSLGYNFGTGEHGPLSVRSHVQTASAPLGLGIPVGIGYGAGYGLGYGGFLG